MKEKLCSIEGCNKVVKEKGWCSLHYNRWYRHGDPTTTVIAKKGSVHLDIFGYQRQTINGKRRRLHRILVEKQLQRPLRSDEVVHHKDHNKSNNNLDNLELLSQRDHLNKHKIRLGTGKSELVICPFCDSENLFSGDKLWKYRTHKKKGLRTGYCDIVCSNRDKVSFLSRKGTS